jgi:hypothetical protein
MHEDDLKRFGKRFKAQHFAPQPRQRPKLGLRVLNAARHYRAAFEAAEKARRELVATVVDRHSEPTVALAALNHLADTFNLPPFTDDDLTAPDR